MASVSQRRVNKIGACGSLEGTWTMKSNNKKPMIIEIPSKMILGEEDEDNRDIKWDEIDARYAKKICLCLAKNVLDNVAMWALGNIGGQRLPLTTCTLRRNFIH